MSKKKNVAKAKRTRGVRNLPAKTVDGKTAQDVKAGFLGSLFKNVMPKTSKPTGGGTGGGFGDIPGESTDAGHKDWVEILKY